ncbi:hypothetical protein EB810_14320 [Altererythrobacter sp. FM1]|nr:hypothetical protein EB810_14320 [Altererythrobacter sp. FM1]
MAGPDARFVRHIERPWTSVTFEGSRHTFGLRFEGCDAIAAGEAFIAALPDHEFAIPGQLVAEATVVEVDHTLVPIPVLALRCELLMLKDA